MVHVKVRSHAELDLMSKQGYALSCSLFILLMETFFRNPESNNNVKNINVCGKGISKVSAYADDVALLTSDIPSIVESLKTYEKFSKVSGLYINLEKTEIMNLIKHINGESLNGKIVRNTRKLIPSSK